MSACQLGKKPSAKAARPETEKRRPSSCVNTVPFCLERRQFEVHLAARVAYRCVTGKLKHPALGNVERFRQARALQL